jgi:hypothetical protein
MEQTNNKKIPASPETVVELVEDLATAFPALNNEFFTLLVQRILANRFTVGEVGKIVTDAIDNITHPQPTIAEIINEHKKKKQSLVVA